MVNILPKRGYLFSKCVPLLFALVVIAGCASPAKKACIQTDWRRVGFEEGKMGHLATHSAPQRKGCLSEGAPPDTRQYEQGRQQGLEAYCTPANGQVLGTKGGTYLGVCPQALQEPFLKAYHKGLQAHARQLEDDIKAIGLLKDKMRKELDGVEEEMAYLEKEIDEAGTGQARLRMGMISEMRMLDADEQSLSLQISALEMDLKEMRQRLSWIKEQTGPLRQ